MQELTTNFTSRQEMEETMQKVQKDQSQLSELCKNLVVTNEEENAKAFEILGNVKGRKDLLEERRVKYTKPLLDSKKAIDEDFKKAAAPYIEMEKNVKAAIATYTDKKRAAAAEEQRRLEAERSAEANRIAEEEGITRRQALAQIEKPVVEVNTSVSTENARGATKLVAKFEIVNPENVPAEYKVVDEKLVRKAIAAGARRIAGVKIWEETQVVALSQK